MVVKQLDNIYMFVLLFATIAGLIKIKTMDKGSWLILILLICSILVETISRTMVYMHVQYTDINLFYGIYHLDSVLDLYITTLYFFVSISIPKFKVWAFLAAIIFTSAGLINLKFQPMNIQDSNMQILEDLCIIPMALIALYKIFISDKIPNPFVYPHFWFWVALLLFWSGSFFFWALYSSLVIEQGKYLVIVKSIENVINIITYLLIGMAIIKYPKTADI